MTWIFDSSVVAAILHVLEEYAYPGGFTAFLEKTAPLFAPFVTANFAIVINVLFLLLCVLAGLVGGRFTEFGLSIAALLGIHGVTHTLGAVRTGRYAPGLVTGVLVYLPLAILAYYLYVGSGQLSFGQGVDSFFLGAAYQFAPIGYLEMACLFKRA